ncbi:MAG: mandelate racemase/muconate lactonizing enzyme family protein [Dehalococcoidia bacterium]|nr:mandelate racemase/muconate lactonizing enzyme family protein [Dehalococcoidia bacterium]
MRIEKLETFIAENWMFVRLTTDDGISGVGESTFFGWPQAAETVAKSFSQYLIGQDPLPVEQHWLYMFRNKNMRGMAIGGAISAIDQALWDIRGKHYGAPVYEILGGPVRKKVRAMLVLETGTKDEVANEAARAAKDGYTAVKVLLFQHEHIDMTHGRRIKDLVERAEAVRDAVGWDCDIGIEIHRNMAVGDSIVLAAELEKLRPLFVEDPVPPDSVLSFAEVAQKVRVPMAAGERNLNIWEFREYVEQGGVHFIRPDVGVAGGITHMKKICALAEAHHQWIIPHAVPSGPVATAAHTQLGCAVPNWEVQEHRPQEKGSWPQVVDRVVKLDHGYLIAPEGPGLGISLNDAGFKKVKPKLSIGPTATRADGSVAFR